DERAGAETAGRQPAGLVGKAVVAVADDLLVLGPGQPQRRLSEAIEDRQVAAPLAASWMARHTRSGVQGISMWRTPRWATASTMAFCTAGVEPMVPDSPIPLAPNGFSGVGVSVWAVS